MQTRIDQLYYHDKQVNDKSVYKLYTLNELRELMNEYSKKCPRLFKSGTTLRHPSNSELAAIAELKLEVYKEHKNNIMLGLVGCFIMFLIFGIGCILASPSPVIGLPFVLFLGIWLWSNRVLKDKLNGLTMVKIHIRTKDLKC